MKAYRLTSTSRLLIYRGDITKFAGDAIVNAANERMLGGGGVDGAIHRAAGPELRVACLQISPLPHQPHVRCPTGQARITPGRFGALQVDYIIHTVGPVFEHDAVSAPLLASAYRSCVTLANAHGLKTLAFPAISCGVFGYPLESAAAVAMQSIQESVGGLEEVHFVLFGDPELHAWTSQAERLFQLEG